MPNLGLQLSRTSNVVPSEGISIPPFAPTDLEGLFEWFLADEGTLNSVDPDVPAIPATADFQIPEPETTVTRWVNRVSSGVNANQTTLNYQPVLFQQEFTLVRYLQFNGDFLRLVYPTAINPPLSYYFFGNVGVGSNIYLMNRATSTLAARNSVEQTGGTLRLRASTSVDSGLNVNFSFFVGCGVLNGDGTGVAGVSSSLQNYDEVSLSGLGTSLSSSTTNLLGAANTSGGNSNSLIAEYLCYNQAHNEADRLKVVNYLKSKYLI